VSDPVKPGSTKGVTICIERGCNRKIAARKRCFRHYQRLGRQGLLETPAARWTPARTWDVIYGKGWLLASEVAELLGCSERNARRMLYSLAEGGRVQVISGGEEGRADLWEAIQDPRTQLELALDDMQEKISATMLSKSISRILLTTLLDDLQTARSAMNRIFTPVELPAVVQDEEKEESAAEESTD